MSISVLSSSNHTFSSTERRELFEVMRDAFARTQAEMWGENYLRMPQSEFENLIDEGIIFGALVDGKIVGCVYMRRVDDDTTTFGLLATHRAFEGKGIGRTLIEFIEHIARNSGAKYMTMDILRPRDFRSPSKDRLRSWYEGMGYAFTHSHNYAEIRPERAKELITPSVFDFYRKEL
jgi:GNAT superfamily N-acetyltransferase